MYFEDEYYEPLLEDAVRVPCRIEIPHINMRYSFLADSYELKALVQALNSCGIETRALRSEVTHGLKILKDTVLKSISNSVRLNYDQLGDAYQSKFDAVLAADGLNDFGNGKYYSLSIIGETESSETTDYYDNEPAYWQMRDAESDSW